MPTGVVKWFNDKEGYGFITSRGLENDIFVHYSAINQEGFKTLQQGQQVQFDVDDSAKGPRAENVSVLQT